MGTVAMSEYVKPEAGRECWVYYGEPGLEAGNLDALDFVLVGWRTRWSTQTAGQAVGTGFLVGRKYRGSGGGVWALRYASIFAWDGVAAIRARQSATIGHGAL